MTIEVIIPLSELAIKEENHHNECEVHVQSSTK